MHVTGRGDPLVLVHATAADAAVSHRISGLLPDARVTSLPGQGHGAMFSAPRLLAAAVEDFVARLRGRTP